MDAPAAIVTGASRGIGRALAEELCRAGFAPLLVARDEGRLQAAVAELRTAGHHAAHCAVDLRDPTAAAAVVDACRHALGPPSVLVNNAGTAPSGPLGRTTDEDLQIALDLHVRAPFALARAALDDLLASGQGVVVQLASTAGLRGYAYTSAYTAAKHGMVGWTRAVAAEFASDDRLRCYAVCPGFVDTAITRDAAAAVARRRDEPLDDALQRFAKLNSIGRLHSAGEVARAVTRLCVERPAGHVVLDLDCEPPTWRDTP